MPIQDFGNLLSDIQSIRFWLTVTIALLVLLCLILSAFVYFLFKSTFLNNAHRDARTFEFEAESLLKKQEHEKLITLAIARESKVPGDATALYYLGLAYYDCKQFVESKKCFLQLLEKEVIWKQVAKLQLEIIDESLSQIKPKLV